MKRVLALIAMLCLPSFILTGQNKTQSPNDSLALERLAPEYYWPSSPDFVLKLRTKLYRDAEIIHSSEVTVRSLGQAIWNGRKVYLQETQVTSQTAQEPMPSEVSTIYQEVSSEASKLVAFQSTQGALEPIVPPYLDLVGPLKVGKRWSFISNVPLLNQDVPGMVSISFVAQVEDARGFSLATPVGAIPECLRVSGRGHGDIAGRALCPKGPIHSVQIQFVRWWAHGLGVIKSEDSEAYYSPGHPETPCLTYRYVRDISEAPATRK